VLRLTGFFVALQILTRLPSPFRRNAQSPEVGSAAWWFPAVGGLLGVLLVGFDALARPWLDSGVVAALILALMVAVTGAFHLDGLVDSVDGLTAGPGTTARLAAMRQAVASPLGALAACILLLADFVAIAALPHPVRPAALLCMPLCGRTAVLAAYRLYPYGRPEATLSAHLKQGATTPAAILGVGFAAAVCFAVGGVGGLALLGLAFALMHGIATVALRRIPGLTGDLHGAICELSQLAVLFAAPLALRG